MGVTNQYYVYILTNRTRRLYVGVTNDLLRRIYEHKQKLIPGFTSTYNLTRLAYYETTTDVHSAISREKQVKSWRRAKKMALVETINPDWRDLSAEWYDTP
ncbi:MAG: GIY-YIG nuclease family protein [Chloroflexi bacterium]|nr:GIY-YIG nuclease family protein [Chloroflexota bacterium]